MGNYDHRRGSTESGGLLVLEGIDGSGKTMLTTALLKIMRSVGLKAEKISFPGRQPKTLGHKIYKWHHGDVGKSVTPLTLQALHVAAHLDVIEKRIIPLLKSGHWIVLDRYWWSTWVYGIASGCSAKALNLLIEAEKVVWREVTPTVVIWLERKPLATDTYSRKLRRAYSKLATQESANYPVEHIWVDSSVQVTLGDAWLKLRSYIESLPDLRI